MSIRGFISAFKRNKASRATRHGGHSLAKTLRESSHVRGNKMGTGGAASERHHQIVAEGHEQYAKSFEDDE